MDNPELIVAPTALILTADPILVRPRLNQCLLVLAIRPDDDEIHCRSKNDSVPVSEATGVPRLSNDGQWRRCDSKAMVRGEAGVAELRIEVFANDLDSVVMALRWMNICPSRVIDGSEFAAGSTDDSAMDSTGGSTIVVWLRWHRDCRPPVHTWNSIDLEIVQLIPDARSKLGPVELCTVPVSILSKRNKEEGELVAKKTEIPVKSSQHLNKEIRSKLTRKQLRKINNGKWMWNLGNQWNTDVARTIFVSLVTAKKTQKRVLRHFQWKMVGTIFRKVKWNQTK